MEVHCFASDTIKDIESHISEALNNGQAPNLGIVFTSVKLGIERLSEALGKYSTYAAGISKQLILMKVSSSERAGSLETIEPWNQKNDRYG